MSATIVPAGGAGKAEPPKPMIKRSESMVERMTSTISSMFDRSNESTKTRQDAVIHVAMFATAIFLIHKFGHKLAV